MNIGDGWPIPATFIIEIDSAELEKDGWIPIQNKELIPDREEVFVLFFNRYNFKMEFGLALAEKNTNMWCNPASMACEMWITHFKPFPSTPKLKYIDILEGHSSIEATNQNNFHSLAHISDFDRLAENLIQ